MTIFSLCYFFSVPHTFAVIKRLRSCMTSHEWFDPDLGSVEYVEVAEPSRSSETLRYRAVGMVEKGLTPRGSSEVWSTTVNGQPVVDIFGT